MAISFVQGNYAESGGSSVGSQTCAYSSPVTAGNMLIVAGGWANTTLTPSISDSLNNTWSQATIYNGGSLGSYASVIYYTVTTSSGTNTITLVPGSPPTTYVRVFIHEYTGVDLLDVVAANASGATGTTATSSSMTTNHANELIFVWPLFNAGTTSAGTGYTMRELSTSSGEGTEDQIVSSTGTYTATANTTTSTQWSIIAATFYEGQPANTAPVYWFS